MSNPPGGITIDVRQLLAGMDLSRLESASPYVLFCCPTSLDPLGYDPRKPPVETYGPLMCALHGWVFTRLDAPAPPLYRGDRSRLFDCDQPPAGFRVHTGHASSQAWLDSNLPTWRAICTDIASVDPTDRWLACRQRIIQSVSTEFLKRFKRMHYDRECGSRDDAIIDELKTLVQNCYDLPGVEATWSAAYRAYRNEDLAAMTAAYAAPQGPLDVYWLLEGLVHAHYGAFISDNGNRTVLRWASIYITRLPEFLPVIPIVEGRRVARGLQYAAMFAERTNDLSWAMSICQLALQHGLWDATKGGFAKRYEALRKKVGVAASAPPGRTP